MRIISLCARQVLDDFMQIHGAKWRAVTADSTEATAMLEPALAKYQVSTAFAHSPPHGMIAFSHMSVHV